jgi:acetylcholinesterase
VIAMMKGQFSLLQRSISRKFPPTTQIRGLSDIRTDSLLETYIKTILLPNITDAEYQTIALAYPSDVTQGSPFGTGALNALTPEFKRLAAFNGDFVFQAPRRLFLNQLSGRQKTWSFCK